MDDDGAPLSRRSAQFLRQLADGSQEEGDEIQEQQDSEMPGPLDDDLSFLEEGGSDELMLVPPHKFPRLSAAAESVHHAPSSSKLNLPPTVTFNPNVPEPACETYLDSEESQMSLPESAQQYVLPNDSVIPSTLKVSKDRFSTLDDKAQDITLSSEETSYEFGPEFFWRSVGDEDEDDDVHHGTDPCEEIPEDRYLTEELESEEEECEPEPVPEPESEKQGTYNSENDVPVYKGAPVNMWEYLTGILTFAQCEHISGAGLGRLLSLIELPLPKPNNFLQTNHQLYKILLDIDEPVQVHFFCTVCSKIRQSFDDLCDSCTDPARKVESFLTFPLENQMKRLYSRPDFVQNIRYTETRVKKNENSIEDIYDGEIYKKAISQCFTINGITFMFNTDGVAVFKSSNLSLWPVYLVVLELPPAKRFLSENLIIAGIWASTVKPHPNVLMVPIYKELSILKKGVDVKFYGEKEMRKVTGTLICGTCDAPATASFLNMKIHSGFYSCPVCLIKGVHPKDATVFPYEENVPLRNMQDYPGYVQRAVQERVIFQKPIKHEERYCGIKGPTMLSYLLDDIFGSMAVDSMHCVHIGVTKQILKLWFVDGKYKNKADVLSQKLIELTPPEFLQRKPQSIDKLIHWKATEFRSFLFHHSVILLQDILDPEDYTNYCCLVKGASLLNSDSISEEDLINSQDLLDNFVKEFQALNGVENMTHNVHMLLHLPRCVRMLGPLWCTSCYSFEDINGRVLNLVHGTRHVGFQIHSNLRRITHLPLMIHNSREGPVKTYCKNIKKKHRLKIGETISPGVHCVGRFSEIPTDMAWVKQLLMEMSFLNASSKIYLFYRLQSHNLLYISSLYRCNRVSSFVKFNSVKYGNIICFAKIFCNCNLNCACKPTYVALAQQIFVVPFQPNGIIFDHIFKSAGNVQAESIEVVPICDLGYIMFKVEDAGTTYLSVPLNPYELQ